MHKTQASGSKFASTSVSSEFTRPQNIWSSDSEEHMTGESKYRLCHYGLCFINGIMSRTHRNGSMQKPQFD